MTELSLNYRNATDKDVDLFFEWANDPDVRKNSFSSEEIKYDDHVKWYNGKVKDENCMMLVFLSEDSPAGQIRIEKLSDDFVRIGISIDKEWRGKSLSSPMLKMACGEFFQRYAVETIFAEIKDFNKASIRAFEKSGFVLYKTEGERLTYKLTRK